MYLYINLNPVFIEEFQNVWNLSAAVDLRRTDIKQQNKNVYRLTFVFEQNGANLIQTALHEQINLHDGNKM